MPQTKGQWEKDGLFPEGFDLEKYVSRHSRTPEFLEAIAHVFAVSMDRLPKEIELRNSQIQKTINADHPLTQIAKFNAAYAAMKVKLRIPGQALPRNLLPALTTAAYWLTHHRATAESIIPAPATTAASFAITLLR